MNSAVVRPLIGLASILLVVAIVVVAVIQFRGGFTSSVPVTVLSQRAGLVMNPDARVKMRGIQVGKVDSIEELPNGQAALHLGMDPSQLHLIPSNVLVNIASTTVFGAKYVQLVPPKEPSPQPLKSGQVLDAKQVTVEINTVFEQLTKVLSKIQPEKLNETLGAIAMAFNGRGEKIGQAFADLDAYLLSAIGLADTGNDVIGGNRQALTNVLRLLVPTTDLTNEYAPAINCALEGMADLNHQPPLPAPGILVSVGLMLGIERYRYPTNLPKVAATGGPQCDGLPHVPFNTQAKWVVTDDGTNPEQYGNPGILLNSDGLKQLLYG